jgi:hypothetical protein
MLAPDLPAAIIAAPAAPADVVVVSRDTRSEVLISRDTALPLIKAGRTENAVLRQAIFLTSTLTVVRRAADGDNEILRWSYEPYLQHQLCFTSITGQFSCAAAEVEELMQKATGEAAIAAIADPAAPGPNPAAEGARIAFETALRSRAAALFATDLRLKFRPMLKAAGVSIGRSRARR